MEKIFDFIEALVDSPRNDGDYFEDGLLYCGGCRTPKQARVELFGAIRTPRCLCCCEAARRASEDAQRQHEERVRYLREEGFPDREMQGWTFDKDDGSNPQLSTIARKYVHNFDELKKQGKGILLYGNIGSGKTFIAACIANALIDLEHSCHVTNFARLTNKMQDSFKGRQDFLDRLNRYELLVIDDLAAERDTEYMNETVFSIIDARYRAGYPLIVTTNLDARDFKEEKNVSKQRVFSRILEMCVPVKVQGVDRRIPRRDDEVRKLLGI